MSYMRQIHQEPLTESFDTYQTTNPTRRHSPGVIVLQCEERRQHAIRRKSPLPQYNTYNYRAPDKLKHGDIPRVTLNDLAQSIKTNTHVTLPPCNTLTKSVVVTNKYRGQSVLDKPQQQQLYCAQLTQSQLTSTKSNLVDPNVFIPPQLSEQTKYTKAAQFRDQTQIVLKMHTGTYMKNIDKTVDNDEIDVHKVNCWSCCLNEDEKAEGCVKIIRHPGKMMLE